MNISKQLELIQGCNKHVGMPGISESNEVIYFAAVMKHGKVSEAVSRTIRMSTSEPYSMWNYLRNHHTSIYAVY